MRHAAGPCPVEPPAAPAVVRRRLLRALAVLAAAPLPALAAGPQPVTARLRHGLPVPAGLGGPIDLVNQRGQRFGLQHLAGRPVLLFFGLLRCGSTCPVALATARQLLAEVPAAAAPAVVFVTLDPLNDPPAVLGEHLARIDPRLIGLTGTPTSVAAVADRYGVATAPRDGGLDHSSMWYLLDARGQPRRVYRHTTPAAQLLEDLRALGAERAAAPESSL